MEPDKQVEFAAKIAEFEPIAWERIPDLGLYMDQVITFIERQYKGLFAAGERVFTPSMVNNYVKQGLVNRPIGKKYSREALAQLLMICVLKQAASSEGIKILLTPAQDETLEMLYAHFCELQTEVFADLRRSLPLPSSLTCAVRNAAYHFLCSALFGKSAAAEGKARGGAAEVR